MVDLPGANDESLCRDEERVVFALLTTCYRWHVEEACRPACSALRRSIRTKRPLILQSLQPLAEVTPVEPEVVAGVVAGQDVAAQLPGADAQTHLYLHMSPLTH